MYRTSDDIAALVVKQLHVADMSVTSAASYYQSLKTRNSFKIGLDAVNFNIDLIEEYDSLLRNIASWFVCPSTNVTEHEIQMWWNGLDWGFWDKKMKSRKFTTFPCDTHSRPLENGRKPDCSHIALDCSKSQYTVVSLNDLKCRAGMFNADDKGKVLDLTKAFHDAQLLFRGYGFTSYLCDGAVIMFFLYSEESILESPPMPLQGIGGRWLLSLLTTDIITLGYRLPNIAVGQVKVTIESFLGQGCFNNVFKGICDKVTGPVVIRQNKRGEISRDEITTHSHVMNAFKTDGMSKHVIQLLYESDCGTALIEQPLCKPIAIPISGFFLNPHQLHQVVNIGAALKAAGCVHLDLRPSNLLTNGEDVVVSDLGSAVILSSPSTTPLSGTTKYGSPEMLRHLCQQVSHTPCFGDDFHSILRVIFVSIYRGAYERLHRIDNTNFVEITAYWERAFSGTTWLTYYAVTNDSDYEVLHRLVDQVAAEF